jgi:hypothetical protein
MAKKISGVKTSPGIINESGFTEACASWPDAFATFAPAGKRMLWRTGRGFVVRDLPRL